MAVSQSFVSSTYEESPEELKELLKTPPPEHGLPPRVTTSRSQLLYQHETQLKLLSEGKVPVRTFVLPLPYPPSPSPAEACRKISLDEICVEKRKPDTVVLFRTITLPYIYSATVTIAEDETGNAVRLTICNLEDTPVEPLIPEGTILAVKQPSWSRLVEGGYHIRVDHPSDVLVLQPHDTFVPDTWRHPKETVPTRTEVKWKKEGDMMFLQKRFREALKCYDCGLKELKDQESPAEAIDLYRKKCGVNIVLLRLDDAIQDLSLAIATHAASSPELAESILTEPSTITTWLRNHSTEDPVQIATQIPRALKELAARIKFDLGLYQPEPKYDIPLISSYVGPMTLHVDAANYISDTEVRNTASHGRGLFAKRAFKAGELVCAEKAFVMPGYFIQDRNSDCFLYNLGNETASPRPGALLFKELVQKLRWNPSLRKEYFELDDGGYWKENGWDVREDEETPVDVFRVEKIRQLNCFSVPTRSLDLLLQPPNSNPELRNGFWIHASYVNHSCVPNTVRTFIGDIHFLRATRDIEPGEELTHQYISPDIDIAERQKKYKATWGFECDCRLCEADGAAFEETRKERLEKFEELRKAVLRIGERGTTITSIKKIARGMRELEALYSPPGETDPYAQLPRLALVHPTLFLAEAWRGVGNIDKTIEYSTKLLHNFGIATSVEGGSFSVTDNAGFVNVETVRALRYLADAQRAKGEVALADECMSVARVWFLVITGSEIGADEFFKS